MKPITILTLTILLFSFSLNAEEKNDVNDPGIETLKQAVKMNPDDGDAYYNLGAAYGKLNIHEEAIEAYM